MCICRLLYNFWRSFYDFICKFKKRSTTDFNNFQNFKAIIKDKKDFNNFINDNKLSKTIFVINNIPSKVYNLLFNKYKNVSQIYFEMKFKKDKDQDILLSHNLVDFNNVVNKNNIRYIYLRINLIGYGWKNMNHVNCIIIDKTKKYILYFEPTVNIKICLNDIKHTLFSICPTIKKFTLYTPKDIGYNYFNKLQRFDYYCQTYILYIFCLILENDNIDPIKYSTLFNSVIKKTTVKYMLYYIYNLLNESDTNLLNCENIYYNDGGIFYKNNHKKYEYHGNIEEDGEYLILN